VLRPLGEAFFARPTIDVARGLLGHIVVSDVRGCRTAGRIVETEAYLGPDDPAAHAFGGTRSNRNASMFGPPGTAYVFFTYGMHWCLNAVTERTGFPAAVLLRALEPLEGMGSMRRRRGTARPAALTSGPAKLTQALGVTGRLDGHELSRAPLRIVEGSSIKPSAIEVTARIGISRAVDWPLRFVVRGSAFASR